MDALTEAQAARAELHKSTYWPAANRVRGSNHLWRTDQHLANTIAALTPPTIQTGSHWVPVADFPTVREIGHDFAVVLANPGDVTGLNQQLDAAQAAGLKLILGLYPEPYTLNKDGSWSITFAGIQSLTALNARSSSPVVGLFVFNEPYWVMKLTSAHLRALRTTIRMIWPAAKIYHDVGAPSQFVDGDPTGVADYVGCWDYPFKSGGFNKQEALAAATRETSYVINQMKATPVWLAQSFADPPNDLVFPLTTQIVDYRNELDQLLPAASLLSWYVWQQDLYPDFLKKHPEAWPATV